MWVARNPPGFAFVWFADEKDAGDAVKDIDGKSISGREWWVEIVSSGFPTRGRGGPSWSLAPCPATL